MSFSRRAVLAVVSATLPTLLGAQGHRQATVPLASLDGYPLRKDLGHHGFAVTATTKRAQLYFNQGLRLFWASHLTEASRSFRAAEGADAQCAMCAWGVALTMGPNARATMEPGAMDTARAAIARAQARLTGASTIERALVHALAARYGGPDPTDRVRLDSAYADAMRDVVARHPNDIEVKVLLADALMALGPGNYWNADASPRPETPVVDSLLQEALARDADHPGACHLFIRLMESQDAARALPCAERLVQLMPGAAHLQHVPAHVYVRVGRYADAITANRQALQTYHGMVPPSRAEPTAGIDEPAYSAHNLSLSSFAATMMGASRLALDYARRAARHADLTIARSNPRVEAMTPVYYQTLVTFGRWKEILATPLPRPEFRFAIAMAYYARGVAFAAKGRLAEARSALDTVGAISGRFPAGENGTALQIAEHALAGEIDLRRGAASSAVQRFRAALALEDKLAYAAPPTWYYPIRQSLGKALLAADRPGDAEAVYRQDLDRFPENGWSLSGLTESLLRQGRRPEAREVKRKFERAWFHADVRLRASRF